MRFGLAAALLPLATLLAPTPASADFLIGLSSVVTPEAGGLFRYEYTLSNLDASDTPAIAFRLDVAPAADLQSIGGPDGWDVFYTPGDSFVTWESSDADFDLMPGGVASFSLSSALGPSPTPYAALGFDGGAFATRPGQTVGPGVSAIPEPPAIALGAIGLATILGFARRGRRHPPELSART